MQCKIPLQVHLFLSGLQVVLGSVGSLIFALAFGNWHAGAWCFLSGLYALFCLHLHIHQNNGTLHHVYSHDRLKMFHKGATFFLITAILATLTYVVLSVMRKIPMVPVGPSLPLAAIQAFMAAKWAAGAMVFSHKYRTQMPGYDQMV